MNLMIKIIIVAILVFPGICSAKTSTAAELKNAVDRFYLWANSVYGPVHGHPISAEQLREDLSKIFTPDISHSLNGKKVVTNINDIYQRFLILKNKYKSADVILPYEEIVIDVKNQKVAISYSKVFIMPNGKKKVFHSMSFFHIRDGKLDEFNQVSSEEKDDL